MEFEKLIKKLMKNLDQLLPLLFFAVMILGPVIKAYLQKKKEQQAKGPGGAPVEEEKAPEWWEQEEETQAEPEFPPIPQRESEPPPPPPVSRIPEPTPVSAPIRPPEPEPVPVAAMQEAEIPIERASDDVMQEAANVGAEADTVSSFSREAAFLPTTSPEMLESAQGARVLDTRYRFSLDRLSPLEAAILLGPTLDRPAAFVELDQVRGAWS